MLAVFALLVIAKAPDPISLSATESVWVYTHASDPAGDEFLRVWGVGGLATPEGNGDGEDWAYGYVKWDVGALPSGNPKAAVLTIYNVNPAGFGDAASAAATPLQARALVGAFAAKTWDHSLLTTIHPDLAKTVFGIGVPKAWGDSKEPIQISIDLMKGPGDFKAYLAAARGGTHGLNLALTSAIEASSDGGGGGKGGVYKVYSAATKTSKLKPMLTLEY